MIVYKLTNNINGKVYIGITKLGIEWRFRRHVLDAQRGSEKAIHRALVKYGPENFTREILVEVDGHEEAKSLEMRYVASCRSHVNDHGYNMTAGGDGSIGFKHSQKSKEKMSRARKGRIITPEWRANLSASTKGRPKTEESNRKRSIAHIGKTKSANHRANIRAALIGRPRPDLSGEQHGRSKLSDRDRIAIYHLRTTYKMTRVDVAALFGISVCHVWGVVQCVIKNGLAS